MSSEPQEEKLQPGGNIILPGVMVPSFRTSIAIQNGVERNILLRTWGGIGDQICAEPALRFALDTFDGCTISLASEAPEFFRHLPFKRVFDLRQEQPVYEKYLMFDTIKPSTHLTWEFISHMLINCVDYVSLCAFRCMLPIEYKPIVLTPASSDFDKFWAEIAAQSDPTQPVKPLVAVHAGKHWQSKTFPKQWWDIVLTFIVGGGCTPVLIGGDADDNRSTVDVNPLGCIDLRGRLTMIQSVAGLQSMPVLLTNDSAPLHMASSGQAWIGYVATCKHPDYISHWRRRSSNMAPEWNWRMKNHGKGGIWDVISYCPNVQNEVSAENVGAELLAKWLPDPMEFGAWGVEKALDPNA